MVAFVMFGVWVASGLYDAMNRARDYRTMIAMWDYGKAFEKRTALPAAIDGWGRPLHIEGNHKSYTIISFGRDGVRDRNVRGGLIANYDCDLVFSNGSFVQYSGEY